MNWPLSQAFLNRANPADLPWWLHWLEQCPSTNTWALERLSQLGHGDVVFTPRQTAGRGQHQRVWHSPPGVLTASFVLDGLLARQLPGLSLGAGLAVIDAIEELIPQQRGKLGLKWPNDVIAQGRKLAGVLCEAGSLNSSRRSPVVVGIGLNRHVNFTEAGLGVEQTGQAISLHELSASVPAEIVLLERLRYYLLAMAEALGKTEALVCLDQLRDRDLLLHRPLKFRIAGELLSGEGAGIDPWGRLLLKLPSGEVRALAGGRVVDWERSSPC